MKFRLSRLLAVILLVIALSATSITESHASELIWGCVGLLFVVWIYIQLFEKKQ